MEMCFLLIRPSRSESLPVQGLLEWSALCRVTFKAAPALQVSIPWLNQTSIAF